MHVIPEVPIYPVLEHATKSRKDSKLLAFQEHTQYVYSAMKNELIKILDEKKRKNEQSGLKKCKTEVVEGRPVEKILEYAESKGIELAIMGAPGRVAWPNWWRLVAFPGAVLERSKCPVTIVR